jgi:hypothetical protein
MDRDRARRRRSDPAAFAAGGDPVKPEFAGWILSLVTIDPAALDDTVERVNIALPRRVLRRLDDEARAAGETRSGYIAKLAIRR